MIIFSKKIFQNKACIVKALLHHIWKVYGKLPDVFLHIGEINLRMQRNWTTVSARYRAWFVNTTMIMVALISGHRDVAFGGILELSDTV